MAIIGEQPHEKHNREAQLDDNRRRAKQIAEATGKLKYIDEFTTPAPLNISILDRVPKCLRRKK